MDGCNGPAESQPTALHLNIISHICSLCCLSDPSLMTCGSTKSNAGTIAHILASYPSKSITLMVTPSRSQWKHFISHTACRSIGDSRHVMKKRWIGAQKTWISDHLMRWLLKWKNFRACMSRVEAIVFLTTCLLLNIVSWSDTSARIFLGSINDCQTKLAISYAIAQSVKMTRFENLVDHNIDQTKVWQHHRTMLNISHLALAYSLLNCHTWYCKDDGDGYHWRNRATL